jgi:hypothetical protein
MPYERLARHVLQERRVLERQLATMRSDSVEAASLRAELMVLRDEYQRLVHEATLAAWPEPPPLK